MCLDIVCYFITWVGVWCVLYPLSNSVAVFYGWSQMIVELLAKILAYLKLSHKGSKYKALLISTIMFEINRALYLELQTYNLRTLTFYVNDLRLFVWSCGPMPLNIACWVCLIMCFKNISDKQRIDVTYHVKFQNLIFFGHCIIYSFYRSGNFISLSKVCLQIFDKM